MTPLTEAFVASARRSPVTIEVDGRAFTLSASNARGSAMLVAVLQVHEGETLIGYITPYTQREHGAISASLFGYGAPRIFSTVEAALRDLVG